MTCEDPLGEASLKFRPDDTWVERGGHEALISIPVV